MTAHHLRVLRPAVMLAMVAVLAACGGATPSPSAIPTPTASPIPTPSPTLAPPAPLVVTFEDIGPALTPWTAVRLSIVGEDGAVAGTVDVHGVDGDAYAVGADHLYFLDGTVVKAMGRDGSITIAGQLPQVHSTVDPDTAALYTAFAVSPDESTFIFGLPLSVARGGGAIADHSQLWTEPVGGTATGATLVYDDNGADGSVALPYAWSSTAVWVSNLLTSGLGGAGPFLTYSPFDPATFDPTSHVLTPVHGNCLPTDVTAIDLSATTQLCRAPGSSTLTVQLSSGTRTVIMEPASANGFGSIIVSNDVHYLAYGAYIGDFGSAGGHYAATVVDLGSGTTVATLQGYTPVEWLADGRLVVSDSFASGATYLLSSTFTDPVKIAPDQPVGTLP